MQASDAQPGKPLTLREEQKLATRDRITQAARTVFARSGYVATSIDDIAAEAGVSRATLYLHFSSKSDLLAAAFEPLQVETAELTNALLSVLMHGSRDDLRTWIATTLLWLTKHQSMARAAQESELDQPEKSALAIREGLFGTLDAWIGLWPAARRDEARLRVELCRLQLQHFAWSKVDTLIGVQHELVAEILTEYWWIALKEPLATITESS